MPTAHHAPPVSLRVALARWVHRLTALSVGFGAVALGFTMFVGMPTSTAAQSEKPQIQRPPTVDLVARLVEKHRCWSGEAPAGTGIPGHAVVTLPGVEPALVDSKIGFDIWLNGRPGRLHAFCR